MSREQLADLERRLQTGVEGVEGEAKYQALRDVAKQQREMSLPPGEGVMRAPAEKYAPPVDIEPLRRELGWAETPRMLREYEPGMERQLTGQGMGEVTGRIGWVPKSEFWPQRPGTDRGRGISEKSAFEAFDKYAKGEKLNAEQTRFIKYAEDEIRRFDEQANVGQYAEAMQAEGVPAEAMLDQAKMKAAAELDPEAYESIPPQLDDAGYMQAIEDILAKRKD